MAGAMLGRTVQIHVNRTCNLQCAHCYSQSGPKNREALDPDVLMTFLAQAREEGYGTLSISGGEPFLYKALEPVLDTAKRLGFATTVVSNATIFSSPARRALMPLFDLLAVSVDGPPDLHNRMRRSDTAFERMLEGLEAARQAGLSFGIIHTVTRDSLPYLPWVAEFAAAQGAVLLQLHPLGIVGAAIDLEDMRLDGEDMARLYLTGLELRQLYDGAMRVHIDLFNRNTLRCNPGLVIPGSMSCGQERRLADVLNPLVVMANGDVSPICHAMHPDFRLGNIYRSSLGELRQAYFGAPLDAFRALCQDLWHELDHEDAWPYFNWYEHLESASYRGRGHGAMSAAA